MEQTPTADLLTVARAAALAGVGRQRINKLIRDGRIKADRLSDRMYLIDLESFKTWMESPRKAGRRPKSAERPT